MVQLPDHPDIASALRTGYPTWYDDDYYDDDETEDEEEDDEDD